MRRATWPRDRWISWWAGLYWLWEAGESRIVEAGDFTLADFDALDWTDEFSEEFLPPDLSVTVDIARTSLAVHVDVGEFWPAGGEFELVWWLEDWRLGTATITAPGRYTANVVFSALSSSDQAKVRWWLSIYSPRLLVAAELTALPPVEWEARAEWVMNFPTQPEFHALDMATLFPGGGWTDPPGWPYGAGVTVGPYPDDRWLYSHADDPIQCDDDLAVDGVILFGNNLAGPVNGGQTTFLHFLPAGETVAVNIWNAGGSYWGAGTLRLYNRPI